MARTRLSVGSSPATQSRGRGTRRSMVEGAATRTVLVETTPFVAFGATSPTASPQGRVPTATLGAKRKFGRSAWGRPLHRLAAVPLPRAVHGRGSPTAGFEVRDGR